MAEKIFIELDDEIIFIVEKLQDASSDNVVLVVPERAALLGSTVSLKLLAQEIAKADKTAVLVSEDEIGRNLAKKSGLVVIPKVSDITNLTWKKAEKLKEELLKKRVKEQKKLVEERHEQTVTNKKEEEQALAEEEQEKGEDLEQELDIGNENEDEAAKEEDTVPEPNRRELQHLEPETVTIEGFDMVSGGDIAEIDEDFQTDDFFDNQAANEKIEEEITSKKAEDSKSHTSRYREKKVSMAGKDLSSVSYGSTKSIEPKKDVARGKGIGEFIAPIQKKFEIFWNSGGNQKKILIGVGIFLLVFFLISYFVLPSAHVVVTVESEDVQLAKKVVADTSISNLDAQQVRVPATRIELVRDRSESAPTTGTEKAGEKATGQITVFNLTESQVKIPAQTVLESIETGRKYITTSEVTVPAKKPDDDPNNPGLIGNVDIGVVADEVGEEFNVQKKLEFRVIGFDIENLYGKNFGNITGGTTEEIKVVSEEDYNALRDKLVEELKADMVSGLEDEAGIGKEVLVDTITYETVNAEATPDVKSEAETFNVSVTVKATALSFSKDDIDALAELLFEQESAQQVDIEEFEYDSRVLGVASDSEIEIDLDIIGVVTPSVDEEELKAALSGMGKSNAEDYLRSQEKIQDYTLELSPGWLPGFLQHFPSSAGRIDVRIDKI